MKKRQLAAAVRTGSPEFVVELYRRENDPKDGKGRNLLHHAAMVRKGGAEIIAALAADGADVDLPDRSGRTALHYAARDENYAALASLIGCGANLFLKDRRGRAPLPMLDRPGRHPHDAIARFTFGYPVMARALLRTLLPSGMVPDDADIRRIDGELVSRSLSRSLRSDTILILERKNAWPFAVIVEFQSGVDRAVAHRMASYRTELAESVQRNHRDLVDAKGRVPFILPVVVHTGADVWNADDNAESLTVPPDHPGFDPYRMPARYMVHDVQREDYSAYEDNPAAAYFRLQQGDPADTLRACEELDRLLPVDEYRPLRRLLFTMTALGSEWFPETALEGSLQMTGFARHFDAVVASNRELMAMLAAERFGAEAGERLKSALDGIVHPEEFQAAKAHVRGSRTAEELFAFFDKHH